MPARQKADPATTPDPTASPEHVATSTAAGGVVVEPEQPTGWAVGNAAPSDQYVEIGPDGQPTGKVQSKPIEGKPGRQLAVKGDTVTRDMLVQLGKA